MEDSVRFLKVNLPHTVLENELKNITILNHHMWYKKIFSSKTFFSILDTPGENCYNLKLKAPCKNVFLQKLSPENAFNFVPH